MIWGDDIKAKFQDIRTC